MNPDEPPEPKLADPDGASELPESDTISAANDEADSSSASWDPSFPEPDPKKKPS